MKAKKWPVLFGLLGSIGLLLFYLLVVGLLSRSWDHAIDLLKDDWPYMTAIITGFGIQTGLFAYMRKVIHQKHSGGNVVAAAGTGTSTATMIVCCLHHLADVAPVIGLSGAAIFLSQYKYPVMSLGILANLLGIFLMLRTICKHTNANCCQS